MEIESTGALATAALVAHEIEREGDTVAGTKAVVANCANCGATVDGKYCSACGQRAHLHRSIPHMVEEFLHGLLHFDAKAWRTMPMLTLRPGQLTRSYIEGQRTRYVSPLALFLFMMFLMFFVVSLTSGTKIETADPKKISSAMVEQYRARLAEAEADMAAARASNTDVAEASAALKKARTDLDLVNQALAAATAHVPAKVTVEPKPGSSNFNVNTGIASVDKAFKKASDNPELVVYKLKSSAAKFTFLLVPLSLPFLWLMFFWRRDVQMYDHAVFVLYSLSFMAFLFIVVALLGYAGMSTIALWCLALIPVHMFLQLRHAYGLSRWGTAWRTAGLLFASVSVICLYLFTILALTVS